MDFQFDQEGFRVLKAPKKKLSKVFPLSLQLIHHRAFPPLSTPNVVQSIARFPTVVDMKSPDLLSGQGENNFGQFINKILSVKHQSLAYYIIHLVR